MDKLKELWDKLAKINSRYYINSDKGKKITETEFRESGRRDYIKLVINDELIAKRNFQLDTSIYELGCGIGRMTEFMASNFDTVYAVDISDEMIRVGKRRLKKLKNIVWLNSNGYDTTSALVSDSVDIAFSYLVFQHMKEKSMVEANFKEVYRVLRNGGLFKVLLRTDKVDLNKWWGGVNYSEKSARIMSEKTGFEVIKTEPVKNYGLWLWLEK